MTTIIVHTALVALLIGFGVKVTQSILKHMDGKVARSTSNIFERYVKFPTIGICVGIDSTRATVGFEDTGARPLNATLDELQFVRHLENGYKPNIIQLAFPATLRASVHCNLRPLLFYPLNHFTRPIQSALSSLNFTFLQRIPLAMLPKLSARGNLVDLKTIYVLAHVAMLHQSLELLSITSPDGN